MTPVARPVLFGAATVAGYLAVVVATTPALPAGAAISAAFELNSVVIIGMGAGIGLHTYISEKGRLLGCRPGARRRAFGGNSGSTAATSFFSFFSLVPLGCCGWWLYVLSMLPGIFGTGVSAVLIEHSRPLAYLGLAVMFGLAGLAAYRLRRQMHARRLEGFR